MANMKECKKCGKVKDYSQFSKKTKSKDGLQDRCKACNKVDNDYFRFELNPEHHAEWQRKNPQRLVEIVAKHRRADKAGVVYALIAPDGYVYVGETKTHLNVRIMEHRVKYRRFLEGKVTSLHPLLFESFNKYGFENHKLEILYKNETISKKELKEIEKKYIQQYKQIGKSLNIKL